MELQEKVVVLTGASRGIGRALAIELAKSRCKLLLTALEENELASFSTELITTYAADVVAMPADLSDPSSLQRLVGWIRANEAPPDILISNAGGGFFHRFATSDWHDIEQVLSLNVYAPTYLVRALLPLLQERPQAKIVLISSGSARIPYPGLAVYGAAKGFISSLSASLACELATSHISVLCFIPGFTRTHFMTSAGMDMRRIPACLIMTPEKVAVRIIRAITRDRVWAYAGLTTRLGVFLEPCMPARVKIALFRHLFWKLPDEI